MVSAKVPRILEGRPPDAVGGCAKVPPRGLPSKPEPIPNDMPPSPNHLFSVRLRELRPTQITVGLAEVAAKRREWKGLDKKALKKGLRPWFPSVIGPKGRRYIVDHHHLGLTLMEEGVDEAWLVVLQDYSSLDPERFWHIMEFKQWAHPYDAKGKRLDFQAIPKRLADMQDDPYRSLAGFVRQGGGYAKDAAPFSEFLWADFFRPQISAKLLRRAFGLAVRKGIALARSEAARYLPGWAGADGSPAKVK